MGNAEPSTESFEMKQLLIILALALPLQGCELILVVPFEVGKAIVTQDWSEFESHRGGTRITGADAHCYRWTNMDNKDNWDKVVACREKALSEKPTPPADVWTDR